MIVASTGTITLNGTQIVTGPFRTQRDVLNAFGVHVLRVYGYYQFPGKIMIWFPDCTGGHNQFWRNEFIDRDHILETLNPENPHAVGIGVGMQLEDYVRIVFAKQGRPGLYYYAGVFRRNCNSTYERSCYEKIYDCFSVRFQIAECVISP